MSSRRLSDSVRMAICLVLFAIGLPGIAILGRYGLGVGAQPSGAAKNSPESADAANSPQDVFSPAMLIGPPVQPKPVGKLRNWTETGGISKIKAQLIDFAGNNVTLRRQDGSTAWFPLERLSERDIEYVQKLYPGQVAKEE